MFSNCLLIIMTIFFYVDPFNSTSLEAGVEAEQSLYSEVNDNVEEALLYQFLYSSSIRPKGPLTDTVEWSISVSTSSYSSPVLKTDGSVIVPTTAGDLISVSHEGSIVSRTKVGSRMSYSTPAIDIHGTIYAAALTNLVAITSEDFVLWNTSLDDNDVFVSSPVLNKIGHIYIATYRRNRVYAFSATDGSVIWYSDVANAPFYTTSPIVRSDDSLYIGCKDYKFYAISSAGSTLWHYRTQKIIYGTAALGPDDSVYFGSEDGNLYLLSSQGSLVWSYASSSVVTGSTLSSSVATGPDDSVYFSADNHALFSGQLIAVASDGTFLWAVEHKGILWHASSPTVSIDGHVYLNTFVGSETLHLGYTYCISPTGSIVWLKEYDAGEVIYASPKLGYDGSLYVLSLRGVLTAFPPRAGKRKQHFEL